MNTPVLHWLDGVARHAAPGAVTLFMVLLGVVPTDIPYFGAVAPALPLTAVYYWVVYRPDLMPRTLVFAAGLLDDVLTATPLGLHALIFLVVLWALLPQRRFLVGLPFPVVWLGFTGIMLAVTIAEWLLVTLYLFAPVPLGPLAIRAVLTIGLFPAVAWVYIHIHRGFLSATD